MRVRERSSRGRVTAAYLEPDVDEDGETADGGYSLSAIKSAVRSRVGGGRGGGLYGEGSSSEGEEEGAERLMRAKDTSSPPHQRDFGAELEGECPSTVPLELE